MRLRVAVVRVLYEDELLRRWHLYERVEDLNNTLVFLPPLVLLIVFLLVLRSSAPPSHLPPVTLRLVDWARVPRGSRIKPGFQMTDVPRNRSFPSLRAVPPPTCVAT